MCYNKPVDLSNIALDISDAIKKTYFIILAKPYADVKFRLTTRKDASGKDGDFIALSVINTGFGEMEVQRVWFLTYYNRIVDSSFIDSKMPVKLAESDRVTYLVPVAELKVALNKGAGDSIAQAVVLDKKGNQFTGRLSETIQKQLAK